jgi:hypothetical protein
LAVSYCFQGCAKQGGAAIAISSLVNSFTTEAGIFPGKPGTRGDERKVMSKCEVCENDYDKTFDVTIGGVKHTFDSFECAIHALAPKCVHCGCHVIGHGVEAEEKMFCCAHCATEAGILGIKDRAEPSMAGQI